MMWETAARQVEERGGTVVMGEKVRTVHWEPGRGVTGLTTVVTGGYGSGAGAPEASRTDIGAEKHYEADQVISSMPFSSLVHSLDPKPPAEVDRKSTRLNSSHANISYAVFCLKKKK